MGAMGCGKRCRLVLPTLACSAGWAGCCARPRPMVWLLIDYHGSNVSLGLTSDAAAKVSITYYIAPRMGVRNREGAAPGLIRFTDRILAIFEEARLYCRAWKPE